MTNSHAVRVANLSCTLGGRCLFDSLQFELEAGARMSIQGPSGLGKTTLLRILAGLQSATSGTIELHGELATQGNKHLVAPHQRGLQMVFQDLGLWPTRSVLRNVVDPLRAQGWSASDAQQRAMSLLQALEIDALAQRKPASLSGGEARRLAFARALAPQPKLLLLDEPFASLDPASRDRSFAALESGLAQTEAAVILVTHDPAEAARLGGESLNWPTPQSTS